MHVAGVWRPFHSLLSQPGTWVWIDQALLTREHQLPANLLALWQEGEESPWLLATNLASPHTTRLAYQRRMWIEEMHGDLKAHGFYWEDSHLASFSRLSRLAFAVTLLYLWLVLAGAKVIQHGDRRLVDRHDRRDLSIFQIGLRWLERKLTALQPIPISSFLLPAPKLSGS